MNHQDTLLFLDDLRNPSDCIEYMTKRGYAPSLYKFDWIVVRNYKEFTKWIIENGRPKIISFDHDLGDSINDGIDCAKWLVSYCIEQQIGLPEYIIHSANPIGAENIKTYFESFTKGFPFLK